MNTENQPQPRIPMVEFRLAAWPEHSAWVYPRFVGAVRPYSKEGVPTDDCSTIQLMHWTKIHVQGSPAEVVKRLGLAKVHAEEAGT